MDRSWAWLVGNLVRVREVLELSRFVGCVAKMEVVQAAGLIGLYNSR
jgi:hypothetical protein